LAEHIASVEIEPSVGIRGDRHDNAVVKHITGLFKTESFLIAARGRA
jgi:hypothetical protein